jgi:hypothetical protein
LVFYSGTLEGEYFLALRPAVESGARAAALFYPLFEAVEIPYEGTMLPGYFFRVDDSGKRRPTVITMMGMDGDVEETYWSVVAAGLERGYHCLAFDGPGQGDVLRQREVPFRPDWEAVVTSVVDFAVGIPEVTTDEEDRDTVERVLEIYADGCPVARSIKESIEIKSELDLTST